jgi:hypothetical protein
MNIATSGQAAPALDTHEWAFRTDTNEWFRTNEWFTADTNEW